MVYIAFGHIGVVRGVKRDSGSHSHIILKQPSPLPSYRAPPEDEEEDVAAVMLVISTANWSLVA